MTVWWRPGVGCVCSPSQCSNLLPACGPTQLVGTFDSEQFQHCALSDETYFWVAAVSSAELGGLYVAWRLLDRVGRLHFIAAAFWLCAAACSVLVVTSSRPHLFLPSLFLLFVARGAALAFNQSLWVVAAEAFPTPLRAWGLGVTTACCRVGGAVTPVLGEYL